MKSPLRVFVCVLFAAAMLGTGGCMRSSESNTERHADANTPAGKLGQAAHSVAVHSEKAAAVAGRKLEKAAHEAHEGWNEAASNDKTKHRQSGDGH